MNKVNNIVHTMHIFQDIFKMVRVNIDLILKINGKNKCY